MNLSCFTRLVCFVFIVAIIVLVGATAYNSTIEPYQTEQAISYSSASKQDFYGIFVRDEKVIKYTGTGVISYTVQDGSRVANGSAFASVYNSEEAIEVNSRIDAIEEEIALLESAQSPGTTEVVQPEFMSSLIEEKYQTITADITKKDFSAIQKERNDFLSLMSIYQIAIGNESDYNFRIKELNTELDELKKKQKNPSRSITADSTGYFVSYTDGYEKKLTKESIGSLTALDIKEIISGTSSFKENVSKSDIGKLIDGYDWKLIGLIDNSEVTYSPGDEVKLKFASTADTVKAVIESITPTEEANESIIILDCDQLTFDLVTHRVEKVEMILHDYEGIKVPRKALRFNQKNEKGVYVLLGQRVMFKKIDIIYECEDYFISRFTSDSAYVSNFDKVILAGVNTADYLAGIEDDEEETEEEDIVVTSVTEYTELEIAAEKHQETEEDSEEQDDENSEESADENSDDDSSQEEQSEDESEEYTE